VDGIASESFPKAGFGNSSTEFSASATSQVVIQ